MNLTNLDNLVDLGHLKPESFELSEFEGLLQSGKRRLSDAKNHFLAPESRFDLAYNASHSLAQAALRYKGYRAKNRFIVFQVLPYTLGLGPEVWRVLAKCHQQRNIAEYEGHLEIGDQLLQDLLQAANALLVSINELEPVALNI